MGSVTSVTRHSIVGIGNSDYPGFFRYLCALDACGITGAVVPLVMVHGALLKLRIVFYVLQDGGTHSRVLPDLSEFVIGKRAGLIKESVGDTDLAYVMEKAEHIDLILPGIREAASFRDHSGILCDAG